MMNTHSRRAIAGVMIVLGGILMFLAPETWPGALVLILGVAIELVGIALENKGNK
jgi:hypothetical protein